MRGTTMSRKNRAQQVMNEYYSKLGPGPYYYDNSAVAAALRYVADRLYTDWGELQHPASVIHEIANEVEDDEL